MRRATTSWCFPAALAGVLIVGLLGAGSAPPPLAIFVAPGLVKLRPETTPPAGAPTRVRLRALRGECELAQVGLRAGEAPLLGVTVALEKPLAPGVTVLLYREALVELARPSGPDGAAGRWPDPLIPTRDRYAGEERSAFPFEVPRRETRAVLLELCVEDGAAPGRSSGTLRVTARGLSRRIPVELTVEPGRLPATSSLPTTFGFSDRRAALGHLGVSPAPEEAAKLGRLYRTALLAHRVAAHGGSMDPPPFRRLGDGLLLDFGAYDAEVGPFLDGTVLPSGARATTTELRTHPGLRSDEERVLYWRAIAAHHRARGWPAILFDYARDEPGRSELPAVAARAKLVRRADPRIRVLLTASHDPSLESLVDLWAPNVNCLFVKESPGEFCAWRAPASAYAATRARGGALWWYASCSSHGCSDEPPLPYFRGWPGYAIDVPGARARGMGWLAFREGIEGELYWDTVHGYAPAGEPRDPWEGDSLRAYGGNGDGTLFYPGTPARVGGTTHVPIESLRLKLLRDGLEDYELLRLVAARPGGRELAEREAARLAPRPWALAEEPAGIGEARERLLDFLHGKGPGE